MKFNIFIIAFFVLLIPISLNSQPGRGNNPKLDLNRGFKEIKLGDSKEKWASSLLGVGETHDGVTMYEFNTSKCCSMIFDLKVEFIRVFFKNNKIVEIEINPYKLTRGKSYNEYPDVEKGMAKFDYFVSQFTILFDPPKTIDFPKNQQSTVKRAQWIGNSTFLEVTYNYYGILNGERIIVIISDLNYLMSTVQSGF